MKLLECYIENYGKISGQKFAFKDGLNCIKNDNGSGKTTLASFIKVMLYGMGDTKKTSLDENDRKHYLPWQGGRCGGTLTFSAGGKTYRIERSFGAKPSDDTFALYDTTLGKPSADFSERVGEELFGIDKDGFERTVFLSERALSPRSDNKSISAKLSDLVGCDGDIGGMDEALKSLEEQRKFYYKKGGSGELSDIKAKIADITSQLDSLVETEAVLDSAHKKMLELSHRMDEEKAKERELMKEREAATIRAAEVNYKKLYNEMKLSLEESVKRRTAVSEVFGATIPTFREIDEASYKNIEAKTIIESLENDSDNNEFTRLADRFDGKVSREEIESAKAAISRLNAEKDKKSDPRTIRAEKIFKNRTPDREEISKIKKEIAKKEKMGVGYIIFILLGLASAVVGAVITQPIAAGAGLLVGLISLILGLVSLSKSKKAGWEKISAFFSSISGVIPADKEEAEARLGEMGDLLSVMENSDSQKITRESLDILSRLMEKFPETFGKEPTDAVGRLIVEYERYASLAVAHRYIMGERQAKRERAEKLKREVDAFISRFRAVSSDPIGELRSALTEYERLTQDIVARRDEMERLESRHEIGESAHNRAMMDIDTIDKERARIATEITALNSEYTLTERLYKSCIEKLEMRDELTMRLSELEDTLKKQSENYDIILLTKKYLERAKDNMTAKYLSKTKESFLRYTEAIGGKPDSSFEMDTDFGISKQEGGQTKSQDAYSRGTRDLYNLASRLALVDSLYDKEKPFIILDDPFTAFDDKKTASAIRLLKDFAKQRQIIYFTCSASRST